MILEAVILYLKDGNEKEFEADFKTAGQYISAIKGYVGHSLQKCIENDNQYLLLVQWEKIENHTVGFRVSAEYQEWKKLLHHYYNPMPIVEHYEMVLEHKKE
jgi:heme-degrading monooxygenase HmoA